MSGRLPQKPAEAIEQHFSETLVGRQHPAMHLEFVYRLQRHAKIQVVQRVTAFRAPQPAAQFGDGFNFTFLAGIK